MRSTFAGSTEITTGSAWTTIDRSARASRLSTVRRGERADVGQRYCGVDDAAVQPVDVEQVLQQPIELARVRGEAFQQVVAVGLDHLRALERERQPEDRGERAAQLVGDRGEERVLHLVERAQPLGGLALALLANRGAPARRACAP